METSKRAPTVSMSAVVPSLEPLPASSCVVPIDKERNDLKIERNTLSRSSSISSEDEDKPDIPDGGWGWVVVFASTVLSMIADGVAFSFGLLYVEFLEEFGASNSATSWIGSLFMAVPLLTGPIMSGLVDKFGCRWMTIVGALISALGFIISSNCYSLGIMYLTFGVLSGLGLGLIYVTAVVSIAFWFDKKRTLAVGLGASGIGIGTFVFSPLTTFLINKYEWRGTTLILGGCFLNMCICGMLMKDPDWLIEQNKKSSKKSHKSSKASLEMTTFSQSPAINVEKLKHILTSGKDVEFLLHTVETTVENNEEKDKLQKYFTSTLNLPTFINENEKIPPEVLKLLTENDVIQQYYPSLFLNKPSSVRRLNSVENGSKYVNPNSFKEAKSQWSDSKQVSLPEQDEALPHDPLLHGKHSKAPRHSLSKKGAVLGTNRWASSSCPNIHKSSMKAYSVEKDEEKWYDELVELVKGMFDYSLFLELHFFLLSLSTIILFVWFIVPYFYVAELMLKHQYTNEDASFTISNIGIASTIGMIFFGWAGDRPWMNITKTYAISLVLCGISIGGIMMFVENFIVMQICASMFGFFLSSHYSFTPGILVEMVPLESFTVAYGLQLLCMGIGMLLGPPYAGLLYDITGNWKQSFYQAAVWTILSGIFIGLIPYTKNKKMIGKGPVEKEIEDSENRALPIILQVLIMLALCILLAYMTGVALL
ncbi:monocarboxylate transporter 14-like isoform X2 [Sitophilus oryzae]|uniref:Monocarboxylate transporter 14-like isoform X2 n=1 Tax=Sitophilus oryzae TaxID=7048 RepID=A0A6J2YGN8_SITOR|nr:monocarboxylate transporter 14-like isoform X2 [Sitophilus oryzae]XP_030763168.1 monocarboxylate transporter 14-like isoform X2 [Sitophilus oryzae]